MTKALDELYYIVDDWAGQQSECSEEAKNLMARRKSLKEEIALRLGADGQDLLETLSNLDLSLEDIHDKALFQAALSLGTEIAQPRRGLWTAPGLPVLDRAAAERK